MTADAFSLGDPIGADRPIPSSDDPAKQWLGEVFIVHYERLCAFAYRLSPSGWVDHEDLVQDAFVNLFEHHSDLGVTRDQTAVLKFLHTTIKGLIKNHRRDDRLDDTHRTYNADEIQAVAGPSIPVSPDRTVTAGELSVHLDATVARLPERRREIWLSRREGLSTSDVASLMGISPGTVKLQMSHAFKFIRQELAPYLDGDVSLSDFLDEDEGGLDV